MPSKTSEELHREASERERAVRLGRLRQLDEPAWKAEWEFRDRYGDGFVVETPVDDIYFCPDPIEDGDIVLLESTVKREASRRYAYMESCARLAAAAPDMARLLLELEWSGYEPDWGAGKCMSCGAIQPLEYDAAARTKDTSGGTHKPDCRLVAVLRKAGCYGT